MLPVEKIEAGCRGLAELAERDAAIEVGVGRRQRGRDGGAGDDGGGLGVPRDDSFGLEVMRERAHRIGARLAVGNRPEGGTAVEVTLGAALVAD